MVHTYCIGNSFQNIFGGSSASMFGYITYHDKLTLLQRQRWPWMEGMYSVSDHKTTFGYFESLTKAKEFARTEWPTCQFKTPAEFREEDNES